MLRSITAEAWALEILKVETCAVVWHFESAETKSLKKSTVTGLPSVSSLVAFLVLSLSV
jgi:hypothetical protein